jgi:hypothetical protein
MHFFPPEAFVLGLVFPDVVWVPRATSSGMNLAVISSCSGDLIRFRAIKSQRLSSGSFDHLTYLLIRTFDNRKNNMEWN